MHDHITSNKKNLTQKFIRISKVFKNPKKFKKTQNLGLNAWNAWKVKDLEHLPSDLILDKVEKPVGKEFRERKECLEGER